MIELIGKTWTDIMTEHPTDNRRRSWRIFCGGEELFGATSFNMSMPIDGKLSHVQVAWRDPKMAGAVIRVDYIFEKIEPGEVNLDGRRVMHMYLIPFRETIGYDPLRLLKNVFKKGKEQ